MTSQKCPPPTISFSLLLFFRCAFFFSFLFLSLTHSFVSNWQPPPTNGTHWMIELNHFFFWAFSLLIPWTHPSWYSLDFPFSIWNFFFFFFNKNNNPPLHFGLPFNLISVECNYFHQCSIFTLDPVTSYLFNLIIQFTRGDLKKKKNKTNWQG